MDSVLPSGVAFGVVWSAIAMPLFVEEPAEVVSCIELVSVVCRSETLLSAVDDLCVVPRTAEGALVVYAASVTVEKLTVVLSIVESGKDATDSVVETSVLYDKVGVVYVFSVVVSSVVY